MSTLQFNAMGSNRNMNNQQVLANNNTNTTDPTGQLSIPLTLSILISESLYTTQYSPVSTLIIPFYRFNLPYGYIFVLGIDLLTAFLVKWSSTHFPTRNTVSMRQNSSYQAVPDMNSIRQVYSLPLAKRSQSNVPPGKISTFSVDNASRQQILNTPLFPKGMTINFSISAPFTDPNSKAATLYTIELKEIKRVPGFFVALLTLVLYLFLYPYLKPKEGNGNGNGNGN